MLTDQERKRFAEWLRMDAHSNRLLAEQLKAMPHLAPLQRRKLIEAGAEELVASILENTSLETL